MTLDVLAGFQSFSDPWLLLMAITGTALGVVVGAMPGLSAPMAIVVLVPVTFAMEPLPALLLLVGIYVGGKLGGSFPAILLRTPGTPASACTALDGHPMALRGEAGKALGYAVFASTAGGVIGWLFAVLFVPVIAFIAIQSSAADIALIGVCGLFMVATFIRGSTVKGLIGVFLGLLIGTIGIDPQDAIVRFTFGNLDLMSGIPFAAAMTGLFGIAVVLSDIEMVGRTSELIEKKVKIELPKITEMLRRWRAMIIGGLYGVGVGTIPGVGAEGSTWLAYATVKARAKDPEEFGKGHPDGIVAPEASNNGVTGGTMVPLLTLGIPGDASTAIMLGALILHGLQPGVTLVRDSGDVVSGILAGLLIANLAMFVIAWALIKPIVTVIQRDRAWLFPFVLVFACIGSFATMNTVFPVFVAIAVGMIGFILESFKFPVVTIVLGIILGPIIESQMRLALALSNGDWTTFVGTWPRVVLAGLILVLAISEGLKLIESSEGSARKKSQQGGT